MEKDCVNKLAPATAADTVYQTIYDNIANAAHGPAKLYVELQLALIRELSAGSARASEGGFSPADVRDFLAGKYRFAESYRAILGDAERLASPLAPELGQEAFEVLQAVETASPFSQQLRGLCASIIAEPEPWRRFLEGIGAAGADSRAAQSSARGSARGTARGSARTARDAARTPRALGLSAAAANAVAGAMSGSAFAEYDGGALARSLPLLSGRLADRASDQAAEPDGPGELPLCLAPIIVAVLAPHCFPRVARSYVSALLPFAHRVSLREAVAGAGRRPCVLMRQGPDLVYDMERAARLCGASLVQCSTAEEAEGYAQSKAWVLVSDVQDVDRPGRARLLHLAGLMDRAMDGIAPSGGDHEAVQDVHAEFRLFLSCSGEEAVTALLAEARGCLRKLDWDDTPCWKDTVVQLYSDAFDDLYARPSGVELRPSIATNLLLLSAAYCFAALPSLVAGEAFGRRIGVRDGYDGYDGCGVQGMSSGAGGGAASLRSPKRSLSHPGSSGTDLSTPAFLEMCGALKAYLLEAAQGLALDREGGLKRVAQVISFQGVARLLGERGMYAHAGSEAARLATERMILREVSARCLEEPLFHGLEAAKLFGVPHSSSAAVLSALREQLSPENSYQVVGGDGYLADVLSLGEFERMCGLLRSAAGRVGEPSRAQRRLDRSGGADAQGSGSSLDAPLEECAIDVAQFERALEAAASDSASSGSVSGPSSGGLSALSSAQASSSRPSSGVAAPGSASGSSQSSALGSTFGSAMYLLALARDAAECAGRLVPAPLAAETRAYYASLLSGAPRALDLSKHPNPRRVLAACLLEAEMRSAAARGRGAGFQRMMFDARPAAAEAGAQGAQPQAAQGVRVSGLRLGSFCEARSLLLQDRPRGSPYARRQIPLSLVPVPLTSRKTIRAFAGPIPGDAVVCAVTDFVDGGKEDRGSALYLLGGI